MSRQIIDTYPAFTITVGTLAARGSRQFMTPAEADEARTEFAEMLDGLKAQTRRNFDVDCKIVEEATCEHCNYTWAEASPDYNGGCCGKDEANSPERLADLQELIEVVEAGEFYRWDADRGRDRLKVDWPWALASAADAWIRDGRPADGVAHVLALAKQVKSSDWCTLWEDPGPSGCSLARRADEVTRDVRPEQLADDLCSLIDDMDLLPARAVA